MKNYWKQFVEWVTDLRANPLASSHVWLVAIYILIAFVAIVAFNGLFDFQRDAVIRDHIAADHIAVGDTLAMQIIGDLENHETTMQILFLLLTPPAAYWVAGLTTRPLRNLIASQRRFIANASHELRTPLAIMKASSEIALMSKDRLTLAEAVETIESNQEEIERMSARIKILLRIVNVDSNLGDVPYAKVDVVYLVNRVLAITGKKFPAADKLNITFNAPKTAFVRGNSLAIEELIVNLLRNAIKYTAPGGAIDISVQVTSTQVRLRVEDTGIGIPRPELSRIFEPFYRTPEAKAYSSGGSGLGLALVKEIVSQHHGKISVQSVVGKGTAFTVVLPALN